MKRLKGNVMLLVLYIMFISSLLGLLVSQYIKEMIHLSSLFTQYYGTYFQAYAGLELWLSQINYRVRNDIDEKTPFGFEDSVNFSNFSNCTYWSCSFQLDIESRGSVITDSIESFTWCTQIMADANPFVDGDTYRIAPGDGFIVPLFYDQTTWFAITDYEVLNSSWFIAMDPVLFNAFMTGMVASWTYLVRVIDDDNTNFGTNAEYITESPDENNFVSDVTPYNSADDPDPENKNYLVVANPAWWTKDFCMELASGELPKNWLTIQSIATLWTATVSFGAIKTNDIPSYLIYTTISWS